MMSYRFWIVYSTFLLGVVGTAASQDRTERLEFVTQRFVDAINAQDYLAARRDFAQVMLDALMTERSKQLYSGFVGYYGKIERLSAPRLTSAGQGVFVAHCSLRDLEICVNLDEHGMIAGLSFRAAEGVRESDKAKTSFRLPFQGQWLVTGISQHSTRNERFAVDFRAVDEAGRLHQGNGNDNEEYFAFGMPVLAPADGVVTDVVTGVRDNMPGSANLSCAPGNMIILEHRQHEVSVMCHLQLDSIKVKRGDKVRQGQMIASCGNSGYSFRPHLHFHVQNTPVFQDAIGLQCEFERIAVMRNGNSEVKARYVPVNADIVGQELIGREAGDLLSPLDDSRRLRVASGGYAYHVLNRAVGKARIFGKQRDFEAFEEVIREAQGRLPMRVLAWCAVQSLAFRALAAR